MEIIKDFMTWSGSLFWGQADFKVAGDGRIRIFTHQRIFPAIQRKRAQSLLAMTEDIRVMDGFLVLIISEEDSKQLIIQNQKES